MIAQLLTQLRAAEQIGAAVVKAAEGAYDAARKTDAAHEEIAALDPGRHQVALGAIRAAIGQVETIVEKAEIGRQHNTGDARFAGQAESGNGATATTAPTVCN